MMAVATQYVSWLSAAAAQAEAAATQATAIAAAFETAVAATVQPAMVAANRAFVQALAATNWFGLNAPAIMDTEAAYEAMWAADVAAMFGYHADASAAVSQLAPWQQALQQLGFSFKNGQISWGPVTLTQGANPNIGFGNSGSQNMGTGNSGNSNFGYGNLGNNNFGFGNTGSNDFGIGLTGNNQIGFGGLNSGSGNIGLFNSGTGNIGFFNSGSGNFGIGNAGNLNMGVANAGSVNTGFFNSGTANAGFFHDSGLASAADATPFSAGHYATGGVGAANLGSGLLSQASASTGGLSAGLPHQGLLNPASAGPAFAAPPDAGSLTGGFEPRGATGSVTAMSGPTPIPPALRTTTAAAESFLPAGATDAGLRGTGREGGIPASNFFKGDRTPIAPGPAGREPGLPE